MIFDLERWIRCAGIVSKANCSELIGIDCVS
jgi:hypothetical protein